MPPLSIGTATAPMEKGSLVGRLDRLLSVDAISDPSRHLFGAQEGTDKQFLNAIFLPSLEVSTRLAAAITEHQVEDVSYATPGLSAIIVTLEGTEELASTHFNATKIKNLVIRLGMPPGLVAEEMANLRHENGNTVSEGKCAFHLLTAVLHAIASVGSDHGLWPKPAFLEQFPAPILAEATSQHAPLTQQIQTQPRQPSSVSQPQQPVVQLVLPPATPGGGLNAMLEAEVPRAPPTAPPRSTAVKTEVIDLTGGWDPLQSVMLPQGPRCTMPQPVSQQPDVPLFHAVMPSQQSRDEINITGSALVNAGQRYFRCNSSNHPLAVFFCTDCGPTDIESVLSPQVSLPPQVIGTFMT